MKPIVDGLERQTKERLNIIRVDIHSPAGKALAERYGFQFTPTFIFFNATGGEEWRLIGRLDPQQVLESLDQDGS